MIDPMVPSLELARETGHGSVRQIADIALRMMAERDRLQRELQWACRESAIESGAFNEYAAQIEVQKQQIEALGVMARDMKAERDAAIALMIDGVYGGLDNPIVRRLIREDIAERVAKGETK